MNNFSLPKHTALAPLQRARSSNSNSIQSIDACRNIKKLFSLRRLSFTLDVPLLRWRAQTPRV
jgi:hypothetical protein